MDEVTFFPVTPEHTIRVDPGAASAGASASVSASQERGLFVDPAAVQPGQGTIDLPEYTRKLDALSKSTSMQSAFMSGVKGTFYYPLVRHLSQKAYERDTEFTADQRVDMVYDADVALTPSRRRALLETVSKQHTEDLLARFREEDAAVKDVEANPLVSMAGGIVDIDVMLGGAGKVGSGALRVGAFSSRMLGREGVAKALTKAAEVSGRGANAFLGDVSASRLKNSAWNMALAAGTIEGAAALSDQDLTAADRFRYLFLSGALGAAFPAKVGELATAPKGLPPSSLETPIAPGTALPASGTVLGGYVREVDAAAAARALDAPEVSKDVALDLDGTVEHYKASPVDASVERDFNALWGMNQRMGLKELAEESPDRLRDLTGEQVGVFAFKQIRERMSNVLSKARGAQYWEAHLGAEGQFHVDYSKTAAGESADVALLVEDAQSIWKKFFPEDKLLISIEDVITTDKGEAKALANGAFAWIGEDIGRIKIKRAPIEANPAKAMEDTIHEIGHAVTIKLLNNALKGGDWALISDFVSAYTRHFDEFTGPGGNSAGSVTAGDLAQQGPRQAAASKLEGLYSRGMSRDTLLRYYESPLEYLAQQFVKSVQQVVREANFGDKVTREAAQASTLFKAMPEAVQGLMVDLLQKLKGLWDWFVDKGYANAAPELHSIFQNLAENPARMWNYSNFEASAASLSGAGQPLPPLSGKGASESYKYPSAPEDSGEGTPPAPPSDPLPPAQASPNSGRVLRWFEDRFGKSWYSVWDNFSSRGGMLAELGSLLVHNGAGRDAFSAAAFKRNAELDLGESLTMFSNTLADATGFNPLQKFMHGKDFRAAYKNLSVQVRGDLMRKFSAYKEGREIPVNSDPQIEKLSQAYKESRLAEKSLGYQKTAGRFGADLIDENPWYVPMRTDMDSIRELFSTGRANEADVRGFLTLQLKQLFEGYPESRMRQIADGVYDLIVDKAKGRNANRQFFEGTTLDELQQAMVRAGVDQTEIAGFLDRFQRNAQQKARDSSLRSRLDWDWDLQYATSTGGTISMRDLVRKDLVRDLEGHVRTVSGQHGLGMVGFRSDADLVNHIEKTLSEYAQRAPSSEVQYARRLTEDTIDALLGRRTGEEVPWLFRASAQLSQAIVLKNSGAYMAVDGMHVASKIGAARFIKNMIAQGDLLKSLKGTDKSAAQRFLDALNGRFVQEGKWRHILTHLEDGYEILNPLEAMSSHLANAARHLNGFEWTRRRMAKATLGAVIGDLFHAAQGGAKEAEWLSKFGATPELLQKIKKELDKHTPDGHELGWDSTTRVETETVLMNVVDQLVQSNRLGEVPAFLQFSSAGKILLPLTSFIAGSWNKVLRKSLADDTGTGFAAMLAYQITGGALAEALRNVIAGREPTDSGLQNYVLRSVTNANVTSWFGLAIEAMGSPHASGTVQFAFPHAVINLARGRDGAALVGAIPGVAVIPGIKALVDDSDE